jgi:hypothetical protein
MLQIFSRFLLKHSVHRLANQERLDAVSSAASVVDGDCVAAAAGDSVDLSLGPRNRGKSQAELSILLSLYKDGTIQKWSVDEGLLLCACVCC